MGKTQVQTQELCNRCGKRPRAPGRVSCERCLKIQAEKAKLRRKERANKGLCTICGKRSSRLGRKTCLQCAERHYTMQSKRRYNLRKVQGLCTTCGKNPALENNLVCSSCMIERAEYHKARYQSLKKKEMCIACAKRLVHNNRVLCKICLAKHSEQEKKRRIRLKAAGLCQRCGKCPPKPNETLCAQCRQEIKRYKLGGQHWKVLERDNFTCQICNRTEYLVVHHKNDKGPHTDAPNNDLNNLITICRLCHNHITRFRRHDRNLAAELILYPLK